MRPVSAEFLRTLRGSHEFIARARVVEPGLTGTNPDGTFIPILGGSVTMDATADVRSTLDLDTDGTGMWPRRAGDLLAPYGNELFVERGIKYGNGSLEWVSQGYYRIQAPEQDNPPNGPIRLAASDRMASIIEARLLAPRQFDSSATYGDVVADLVNEVAGYTIEWDDGTEADTLDRTVLAEEDRFGFLNDLVKALGKVWYFDYRGILVIKDPPDASSPVWDVNHGAGGVLVEMSRDLSREGVYNAVVATGEAADAEVPARAVVYDNNPNSPTYWLGTFGKVPRFYSSSFITTDDQAFSAASSMLRQSLGLPYNVDLSQVPNPALEPLDPVRVSYSDSDARELHVLKTLTVPLTATEAQAATTQEQTNVLIGTLS